MIRQVGIFRTICITIGLTMFAIVPQWLLSGVKKIKAGRAESVTASRLERTSSSRPTPESKDLALAFERNDGQTDPSVQFMARGAGYTLFLTETEAVLSLQQMNPTKRRLFESGKFYRGSARFSSPTRAEIVRIKLPNVKTGNFLPVGEHVGVSNYFVGDDPRLWHAGVPTYAAVKREDIYPGVDLVYHGHGGALEFDFDIKPGFDPGKIRIQIASRRKLRINADGELEIETASGSVSMRAPCLYQMSGSERIPVAGGFALTDKDEVGFQIGSYDRSRTLVIDPELAFSSYLGGNGSDDGNGIAVDISGNTYIAGQTTSTNFPTKNGYTSTKNKNGIAFVSKVNHTGTSLLYSTYLGGSTGEGGANSIAVNPSGIIYVAGYTTSSSFPVVNGLQTSIGTTDGNGFVARIDATKSGVASLVYSTYLGGGGNATNPIGDTAYDIAVDSSGLAYVTGQTTSDNSTAEFPTTSTAYQSALASPFGNAFLTVLDTTQAGTASLIYSTYLGGASSAYGDFGLAVAVDNQGDAYLTGATTSGSPVPFPTTPSAYQTVLNSSFGNAFITEINTNQSGSASLIYSTFFGGSGESSDESGDVGQGVALDSAGFAYISGTAASQNFPTSGGAFQTSNSALGKAFVAKLDLTKPGIQALVYSTFVGGTNGDMANGISVDSQGNAFVVGSTASADFPTTSNGYQLSRKSTFSDPFVSQLNSTGTALLYSTFFGGSCGNGDFGNAVTLDFNGNPYLTGSTCSTDFPTYPSNAYKKTLGGAQNAFAAKLALVETPGINAAIVPTPNSSGWNNTNVTVSFTCVPGGAAIQSCSSPATVTTNGANQMKTGTAVDTASNRSTTTVAVNFDSTPPVVAISSPSNGAVVTGPYVVVTGTVTDSLSGPGSVACNGIPSKLMGSTFSCTVSLFSPSASITVTGTDLAGNFSTATTNVSIGMATPSSLQITPGPVTTTVGSVEGFTAIDQNGNRRPDATWSVNNPAVASLSTDGSGTVTGVAAGQVTLTANVGSVSGQTQITVLAGSSVTTGTVLWTTPAVYGFTAQNMVQAVATANGPDIYSVETNSSGDLMVRAFSLSGGQLWQSIQRAALPQPFSSSALNAVGDGSGGLLVVYGEGQVTPGTPNFITHFQGLTGQSDWKHTAGGALKPNIAVGSDGTIFAVDQNFPTAPTGGFTGAGYLDSLNGSSGALLAQVQLPIETITVPQNSCNEAGQPPTIMWPGQYGSPIVTPDGTVYLEVQGGQVTANYCLDVYPGTWNIALLQIPPSGSPQFQAVTSFSLAAPQEGVLGLVSGISPDGQGGVLASWIQASNNLYENQPNPIHLADIGPKGIVQTTLSTVNLMGNNPTPETNIALGDNGVGFITDGTNVTAYTVPNVSPVWTFSSSPNYYYNNVSIGSATTGEGMLIDETQQGLVQISSSGNAGPVIPSLEGGVLFGYGTAISGTNLDFWTRIIAGKVTLLAGPPTSVASLFAQHNAGPYNDRSSVPRATFLKGPVLGPKNTYAGQTEPPCDPRASQAPNWYGYHYCAYYQLQDQNHNPLAKKVNTYEVLIQIDTNIQNVKSTGGSPGNSTPSGKFTDELGLGHPGSALPSGSYYIERQIISLSLPSSQPVLRTNCIDFELTDLGTFKDVTSQSQHGQNAQCTR